mmetsp:Transcript_86034/g.229598  ORF Transcript_86034/g.229598 Transcript_86034/m.229598 type:complete len:86 (-) Transcript_86034:395-652(-)
MCQHHCSSNSIGAAQMPKRFSVQVPACENDSASRDPINVQSYSGAGVSGDFDGCSSWNGDVSLERTVITFGHLMMRHLLPEIRRE